MSNLPEHLLEDKNYEYDLKRSFKLLTGLNNEELRIMFDNSNNQGKKNIVDGLKINSFMENTAQQIRGFINSNNLTSPKDISFEILLKNGEVTYRSVKNIG